jgi:signal transduction histidine kinase
MFAQNRVVWTALLFIVTALSIRAAGGITGMPIVHSYPFEDIGDVPPNSHLTFDRFGRLAITHDSLYYVLNDSVWLRVAEYEGQDNILMGNIAQAADGQAYYGARGSWGRVSVGLDNQLHAVPLNPKDEGNWIATGIFDELMATEEGVYFQSWNGFAYWDFQAKKSYSFSLPPVPRLFRVGQRTYVSARGRPLTYFDRETHSLLPAKCHALDEKVVEFATPLDKTRSLLRSSDGRMLVFDERTVSEWMGGTQLPPGSLLALQHLVDDKVAISVQGKGLFIFSLEGQLQLALTSSNYYNVIALANREPGVLWIETESMVQKILFEGPVSYFGQEQGLATAWPAIVMWQDRPLVTSSGKLYQLTAIKPRESAGFELLPNQPPAQVQDVAVCGSHLLLTSSEGLYAMEPEGAYTLLPSAGEIVHLVALDNTHCFTIGRKEIGLLEWQNGQWIDSVPKISGIVSPSVVHLVGHSVWIEMGGDGVARLRKAGDRLVLDVIRNETWTKCRWVNIGVLDNIAMLSGLESEPRRFFDESKDDWCDLNELQNALRLSPRWIARVAEDETGRIWATNNQGLMCLTPDSKGYRIDPFSFDLVTDRYPLIKILPGNDIWVTAERSLYHIEPSKFSQKSALTFPILVSALYSQRELLNSPVVTGGRLKAQFTNNDLSLRFFSGTDNWRKPPGYEYRIGENDSWKSLDGTVLSFHELREGRYNLQVRFVASLPNAAPFTLALTITPPWQRAWQTYLALCALLIALAAGSIRYVHYLGRSRARKLEALVQDRTKQLEEATIQLSEEARKAATLSERNRVANEIHDSVQQGLTGAILQLDTTIKLGIVVPEMLNRLTMVRNTVSYVRQEVQHTIWDVESPLLEGASLPEALHHFTKFIDAGATEIQVEVSGTPTPLGPSVNHNLLRVAQEATANAIRHAHASRIAIELSFQDGEVVLEVRDNGIGFNPEPIFQKAGHLGLRGMRGRVKRLGGKLLVESTPKSGTTIRAVIPT